MKSSQNRKQSEIPEFLQGVNGSIRTVQWETRKFHQRGTETPRPPDMARSRNSFLDPQRQMAVPEAGPGFECACSKLCLSNLGHNRTYFYFTFCRSFNCGATITSWSEFSSLRSWPPNVYYRTSKAKLQPKWRVESDQVTLQSSSVKSLLKLVNKEDN